MASAALIPIAVFTVVCGAVGVRLVGLWRRTRGWPELCLGGGLALAAVALPFAAFGRSPEFAMTPAGRAAFGAGMVVIGIAMVFVCAFNAVVFRQGAAWARVLAALVGLVIMGSTLRGAWLNAFAGDELAVVQPLVRPNLIAMLVAVAIGFAWGSAESFVCWRNVRRRAALGLGDPVLANRFLLWGCASATSTLMISVIAACSAAGMIVLREPLPAALIGICGTVMSICWALTFFAPKPYLDLIRRRASQGRS